ncbi:MAG: hypothetical protein IKW46_02090 [Bacteroidaceae bacterium]|nr:hypothetical protein [Bacteroidaceae bacterium]
MNDKEKVMNSDANKALEGAIKILAPDFSKMCANVMNGERIDKGCSFEFSQEKIEEEIRKRSVTAEEREKHIIGKLLESLTEKEWKSEIGCKLSVLIEDLIGIRSLINCKKEFGISLTDNEIMYLVNVMNAREE